jgi:flagellar motor switch protein FliM
MLNFCLPASMIETVGEAFTHSWYRAHRGSTSADLEGIRLMLGRLPLHVAATVETTLSAREVLELEAGDVISLGHRVCDPLDGRVNDLARFKVMPTLVGGRAGMRVLESVGTLEGETVHG